MDARTRAQYEAWYLRQDMMTDGHFTKSQVTSATWQVSEQVPQVDENSEPMINEDGEPITRTVSGYRWAVRSK